MAHNDVLKRLKDDVNQTINRIDRCTEEMGYHRKSIVDKENEIKQLLRRRLETEQAIELLEKENKGG